MSLDQILFLPPGYGFDSAAWTPASLSSTFAWYSPNAGLFENAGTDPAELTDPVYQQNDQSTNGRNLSQVTLGVRPVFSTVVSQNMLTFTGASQQFLTHTEEAFVADGDGFEVWAVAYRSSNSEKIVIFSDDGDAVMFLDGTTAYIINSGNGLGSVGGATTSGLMLIRWRRAAGSGNPTFTCTGLAETDIGTTRGAIDFSKVGQRTSAPDQCTNGSHSHIILLKNPSAEDSALVEAYLTAQTGAAF